MRALGLALASAVLLATGGALANGAFPNGGQLVLRPGEPNHMALRTSFGILLSTDAGRTWGLACERGIGYVDEAPAIAITGDGHVLAAWSDGVGRAPIDDGCDWALVPDVPVGALDVSVQKDDFAVAVALTHDRVSGEARLWESTDHGASWSALGAPLPSGIVPTTVDVATSDPQRIYVAGTQGANNPVLARSVDRGAGWTVWSIATDVPQNEPFLAALDPTDEDLVYVRTAGDPGRLLVSANAGEGWVTGFYATGPMRGFALSPDGQALMLGDILGIWRAPTSTLSFVQQSETFSQCLAWAAAGVYGCSNQFVSGFFLGLSLNEGASFTPLLSMHCIRLFDCDPGTTVGGVCPDDWPMLSDQLQSDKCDEGGQGGAGGAGGAGGSGGGSGGATNTTSAGAGGNAPPGPSPSGGCQCGAAAPRSSAALWWVLAAMAAAARWAGRARSSATFLARS